MTREEIRAVYDKGPDAVIALVEGLITNFERIYQQQALQITILEARVKHLEDQLNQNSRNTPLLKIDRSLHQSRDGRCSGGKNPTS